jgi:protein-L-isoaspartate(D-aspartate) O-methyltransferase
MADRTPALDEVEAALGGALDDRLGQLAVRSLRRDPHDADDSYRLHGQGWCLSWHGLP